MSFASKAAQHAPSRAAPSAPSPAPARAAPAAPTQATTAPATPANSNRPRGPIGVGVDNNRGRDALARANSDALQKTAENRYKSPSREMLKQKRLEKMGPDR